MRFIVEYERDEMFGRKLFDVTGVDRITEEVLDAAQKTAGETATITRVSMNDGSTDLGEWLRTE